MTFQVGVTSLPVSEGRHSVRSQDSLSGTDLLVHAYYISADAPNPNACWDWLVFLSDQAEIVKRLPARRSVAASSSWQSKQEPEALTAYLATLEDSPVLPLAPLESGWLVYTYPWLQEAFEGVLSGTTASLALEEAQAKAEAFLVCLSSAGDFLHPEALSGCAK